MADDGVTIQITGLDEVKVMFDKLATKSADRAMRKALRAGAQFEQAAQASAAPVRPDLPSGTALPVGALSNDVGIRLKRTSADSVEATVGPNKATVAVANFVEYGHRMVKGGYSKQLKNGKTIGPGKQVYAKGKTDAVGLGTVPAHPYIRNTWESTVERVTDIVVTTFKDEVTKAAAKGGE